MQQAPHEASFQIVLSQPQHPPGQQQARPTHSTPQSTNLNVVYYSQTDLTPVISLTQVCADPNIDIVILAFVTNLVSAGGYPAMNMASNCWAPNAAQQAAGATGAARLRWRWLRYQDRAVSGDGEESHAQSGWLGWGFDYGE